MVTERSRMSKLLTQSRQLSVKLRRLNVHLSLLLTGVTFTTYCNNSHSATAEIARLAPPP